MNTTLNTASTSIAPTRTQSRRFKVLMVSRQLMII